VKLAFISESPADEAALAAFCHGVLGREIETIITPVRVRRGWPALKDTLGPALRALKLTDATLVVVCVDGDGTDPAPGQSHDRREQLARLVAGAGMSGRVEIALAVPQIEAWWLAPQCPELHEKGWFNRRTVHPGYEKADLKRRLYGTDRASLSQMTAMMSKAAREAAVHHAQLATRFPLGLAPLIRRLNSIDVQ
jgi:hypothetical protein